MVFLQAKVANGRLGGSESHQAKSMRRSLPPLQVGQGELLSRDAAKQTAIWSKENDVILPCILCAHSKKSVNATCFVSKFRSLANMAACIAYFHVSFVLSRRVGKMLVYLRILKARRSSINSSVEYSCASLLVCRAC